MFRRNEGLVVVFDFPYTNVLETPYAYTGVCIM